MRNLSWVLFSCFVIVGCGPVIIEPLDGSGGGGGGEPGGTVSLSLGNSGGFEFAGASATFIKSITGGEGSGSGTSINVDECVLNEAPTGGGSDIVVEYFDVGDTVTLEGGGSSIELEKGETAGIVTYAPAGGTVDTSLVSADTDYDVSLSGSVEVDAATWSSALSVPSALNITSPDLSASASLVAGAPLTLEWDAAGLGELNLFIGGTTSYTCRVNDDGSFEIDASVVDGVDQAGAISLGGSVLTTQDLAGRSVTVIGSVSAGGSYSK